MVVVPRLPQSLPLAQLAGLAEGEVVGVDEAGRGPWAGPVVAAAVRAETAEVPGVTDSKRLSEAQREEVYRRLTRCLKVQWAVSVVGVGSIDKKNILQAAHEAMARAVSTLERKWEKRETAILVDGGAQIHVVGPYGPSSSLILLVVEVNSREMGLIRYGW